MPVRGELMASIVEQEIDEPRCAVAHIADTIQIEAIAVFGAIDDSARAQARSQLEGQLGGVEIVDLTRIVELEGAGSRSPPAMRSHEQERRLSRDPREPIG